MATITVTTANDTVNAGDGVTSLREAVTLANAGSNSDTIVFDASLAGRTLFLTGGELILTQDVTIDGDVNGDNKADITISGINASRIFSMSGATTDIDLMSLTLTNGYTVGYGGAVYVDFSTPIASLDIFDTTILNSHANASGGALNGTGNDLTLTNVLLSGNSAGAKGGAIHLSGTSTATITNTTVYGNMSNDVGGGISLYGSGVVTLYNSTVTGNLADANGTNASAGGGISSSIVFFSLHNSVVSGNSSGGTLATPADNDIQGTIINGYNNFLGNAQTISFGANNIIGAGDPLLGELADNGGTTQTRNILDGSQLINVGTNDRVPTGLTEDANGNDRILLGTVDIGATEYRLTVTSGDDTGDDATNAATLQQDMLDGNGLSLREAIHHANAGDSIYFADELANQTIVLNSSQLGIYKGLTIDGDIDGDNKADITISGNNANRVFNIYGTNFDVNLKSLDIANGNAFSSGGGAVYATGTSGSYSGVTVNIINSTLRDSTSGLGGGVGANYASLNIVNSTILNNSANTGGGINLYGFNDTLTVTNSTLFGNNAASRGGGIFVEPFANISVDNSTIVENSAGVDGGGLDVYGVGGFGTAEITNTIVANNTANGIANDVNSTNPIDANNSFFGTVVMIDAAGVGNINGGGDPLLGQLSDNGGATLTLAPLSGSPVIDAGGGFLPPDVFDLDDDGVTLEFLPIDGAGGARLIGPSVDIGAVEAGPVVTTVSDAGDDATIGASLLADIADGNGLSLREAIGHANAGETIVFSAALAGQAIVLNGSELVISQDLNIDGDIDGDNKADITISGNNASRIFNIENTGTDVNLLSLDLADGVAGFSGGGAVFAGEGTNVVIVDSTLRDSTGEYGGAVRIDGSMTILNSAIFGNYATSYGGGIIVYQNASLELANTTIYNNGAGNFGGGIHTESGSSLTIFNSTIVGNSAILDGGGLYSGGGIAPILNIFNSIVVNNTADGIADDIDQFVQIANFNFFGTTQTIASGTGNIIGTGTPVLLGELLDNGGTTLTLSPLDGSPVIGTGSNAFISPDNFDQDTDGDSGEPLPFDGRGGLRIVGGTVDIGAVEQIVDEVIGGTPGNDNIVGGLGNDTATYKDATTGVAQYLLFSGVDTGGAGIDTLSGIENLTGSAFDDRLVGDGNDNVLSGGDGDDILKGKGGNDTFNGGNGNDKMVGGAGDDTMFGGDGNDTLIALAGLDILNGGKGDDFLFGGKDNDTLNGNFGSDNIRGNLGTDILNGGAHNDILRGGGQNDILNGDTGNDFLFGENHSDTLFGGTGDDSLTGGFGGGVLDGFTDTFIYKDTGDGGGGFDRIKDFENGIDRMDLQSFGFADFAAVQALASDTGVNMRINFGGGDVLFVENFQVADFDVGDVLI